MPTTFVTAFYLQPETATRRLQEYFYYFEVLAGTGVPILLYLDAALKETGEKIVGRYSNVKIPEYVTLDVSWTPCREFVMPNTRDVKKDNPYYMFIQLSKLHLLKKAVKVAETEFLAWLDFGAFHMWRDIELCKMMLVRISTSNFPKQRILIPGCWGPPNGTFDIWNNICWRFCGTFLLGHKSLFQLACNRQTELVRASIPKLTWEVNYWTMMEEHFQQYWGDHNEALLYQICNFITE